MLNEKDTLDLEGTANNLRVFADMLSDTLNGTFKHSEVTKEMLSRLSCFCSDYLYQTASDIDRLLEIARTERSGATRLQKDN